MDRRPMRKRDPSSGITGGCYYLKLGNDFDLGESDRIHPVGICLDTHAWYCTLSDCMCYLLTDIYDDEAELDKRVNIAKYPKRVLRAV